MTDAPLRALPVSTPFDLPFTAKVFSVGDTFNSMSFTVKIPDNFYIELISFSVDFDTAAGIRSQNEGAVSFTRAGQTFVAIPAFRLLNNIVGRLSWGQFGSSWTAASSRDAWLQMLPAKLHLYPDDLLTFNFPSWVAGDIFGPLVFHGHTWEVY